MKAEGHLDRCRLKGTEGDTANAILTRRLQPAPCPRLVEYTFGPDPDRAMPRITCSADAQIALLTGDFPFIECVFANGGCAGARVAATTRIIVEIGAKSPDQIGFAELLRRWVVERFFAWINCNRRLAKDFEAAIEPVRAFLYAAPVMVLSHRATRSA